MALSFLLGDSVLYLIYGEESFLYALQFAPMLVFLASLGTTGRFRPIVIAGAMILIACNGINNMSRFLEALTTLDAITIS